MKLLTICIFPVLLLSPKEDGEKKKLFCQKWREVGIKFFNKEYKSVSSPMSELIVFKPDGTFDKELYGQLKFKGNWAFNATDSKFALAITEMNGQALPGQALDMTHLTDSIAKLTKDTLIWASLAYYGAKKIYGHDDRYFVREK
jgi:hypothetical protein